MLRINKDVEHALISLVEMSREKRIYSARELSDHFQIPFEILSKTLQRLAGRELIASIQGPRGGYILKRSISDITLYEVVNAIHDSVSVVPCIGGSMMCKQEENCNIKEGIEKVQSEFDRYFHSLTLESFVKIDEHGKNNQVRIHDDLKGTIGENN
ncbi:MAG TPA: Rrf2 family transcriptional regulator [Spirochaetes bacterium]|nr:Rrf2 family transcriptional regulator [Spirochaetota bacterium]